MTLLTGIATVVVLLLIAVALLPSKKRDSNSTTGPTLNPFEGFNRSINLREQQLREESEAIASEYKRRSNEAWLDDVSIKASELLKTPAKPMSRKS